MSVAFKLKVEEIKTVLIVGRLDEDAGPIDQVADIHQETIDVDGMPSREAEICGRRVLTQSTAPYENGQIFRAPSHLPATQFNVWPTIALIGAKPWKRTATSSPTAKVSIGR